MTPFPDSAPSVRTSLRTGREKWLSASMAALATVVTAALVWLLATAVPSTASGQAEPVTSADRLAGSDVGLHPRVREIDAEAMTQRSIELVEALNVASVEATRAEVTGMREQILTVARKQLGDPYRAGGAGPDSFDCGGFTQFVFKRALGIDIARTSWGQYDQVQRVKTKDALPGDLVFFFEGGAHHVGIYLGDGQMIDAPQPGKRISVNPISGSWWGRSFTGIGRILPA
ncbi:MAG: NlpC/P60 family protein [Candidatus Nanopelagicales bacterium]|nr:NlpC/P60 family protein [Candidatus Nanopelagicales bacterium]